jgi:23S rRNA pseudouridine1911/1915/1917 synthase
LLPRQALYAKELGFNYSATGEFKKSDLQITNDLQSVIDKWETYVAAR